MNKRMSWLKIVNVFFFQWFFVRLTRCSEQRVENYKLISFDLTLDGISSRGYGATKTTYEWYAIQYWIVPTTGWKTDFIFVNQKPKFIKITNEKIK